MTINLLPEQMRGKEPEKRRVAAEKISLEYEKPEVSTEPTKEGEAKIETKKKETLLEKPVIEKRPAFSLRKIIQFFQSKLKVKPSAKTTKESLTEEEPLRPTMSISLMPGETAVIPPLFREKLIFMIVILVIILLVDFLFLFWIDSRYSQAKARVDELKIEINQLEAKTQPLLEKRDQVIFLNRKVARMGDLLESHIYWSNLFNFLETYIIPEVWLGDFTADTSAGFIFPAQAKDLISVARQIVVLREAPLVKEVEVLKISKTVQGVSFQLKLILDPKVFKK